MLRIMMNISNKTTRQGEKLLRRIVPLTGELFLPYTVLMLSKYHKHIALLQNNQPERTAT